MMPRNGCKVPNCPEPHSKHYCKNCQSKDSNHFASQCPNNRPQTAPDPHCRVAGCLEPHTQHHCRNCQNSDSNHFASQCPEQITPKIGSKPISQTNIPSCNTPPKQNQSPFIGNTPPQQNQSPFNGNAKQKSIECKVKGCQVEHEKHFCKQCKNQDSEHFSKNCPKFAGAALKCRVPHCTDKHQFHFCKYCLNADSDHFKKNCTNRKKFPKGSKCKVKGCKVTHDQHFCRFCEIQDSNHFAKDCPKVVDLCHATKVDNLEMERGIGKIGLQPGNSSCRFGAGIYFAELGAVQDISENKFKKEGVVLKCKVFLGKNIDFGDQDDPSGNWAKAYDSCTAMHPPWFGGVTKNSFREFCIQNPKKCKIYSLIYKGTELKMEDYQKHSEILERLKNL